MIHRIRTGIARLQPTVTSAHSIVAAIAMRCGMKYRVSLESGCTMSMLRLLRNKGKACRAEYKLTLQEHVPIYDFSSGLDIDKVMPLFEKHNRRFTAWGKV